MSFRRRAIGCCAAIALAQFVVSESRADPDVWTIASQPRLAADLAAYRDAERFLSASSRAGPDADRRLLLAMAVRSLDRVGAADSPDPRPPVMLGRVLSRLAQYAPAPQGTELLVRASEVLQRAIAADPDHPVAVDARFALAVVWARLGQPRKEIAVYDELLEREPSRQERVVVITNRAEALMVAGDLDESVVGYRAAIRLAGDQPLAHWGLAIALDRSGDEAGAVASAANALRFDPESAALHDPNVFFLPAYDRWWYDALGAMAHARAEKNRELARSLWAAAASLWTRYLELASPDDRWVRTATARRKLCELKARAPHPQSRGR